MSAASTVILERRWLNKAALRESDSEAWKRKTRNAIHDYLSPFRFYIPSAEEKE